MEIGEKLVEEENVWHKGSLIASVGAPLFSCSGSRWSK